MFGLGQGLGRSVYECRAVCDNGFDCFCVYIFIVNGFDLIGFDQSSVRNAYIYAARMSIRSRIPRVCVFVWCFFVCVFHLICKR